MAAPGESNNNNTEVDAPPPKDPKKNKSWFRMTTVNSLLLIYLLFLLSSNVFGYYLAKKEDLATFKAYAEFIQAIFPQLNNIVALAIGYIFGKNKK